MTKDLRRSSIAGSAYQSPRDGEDETPAPEGPASGDAASNISPSAASIDGSKNSADANGSHTRGNESQPMTASNSNSSTKEGAGSGTGPGAVYGTRSRNRTGNSRPNYAEDREIDIELEALQVKENSARKGARSADAAPSTDDPKPVNTTRKAPGPETEQPFTMQTHYKESIPGTSTFSANPTSGPAKKRKAAAAAAATLAPAIFQPQLQSSAQNLPSFYSADGRSFVASQVLAGFRETNMLSFENCRGQLKDGKLVADDGTMFQVNDHAYLVCEPPGEPYYLGRIMEFLHVNNDSNQPIDALRLNWYYRPKDIGRKVNDTRQVFASMHSDVSPLTALRGKCQIKHKSEAGKLDDLRRAKDSFWYEKLYDRYIHRYYDVVPTKLVINVPVEVKKVLDERWKYIVVEPGRGKELTSAVKSCKRCNKYCASGDSVDCAVCKNTYHMSCVNPPLLKKPSRGFAWACGPCSKAQEKRLEARNTPNVTDGTGDGEDEEPNDEDDAHSGGLGESIETSRPSPSTSSEAEVSFHPGTAEQQHQASLWLFRYLGIHCRVEDALDYDDRIYPRASSRLGPRHQANVSTWPGRPVEYIKTIETKRKYVKGGAKKDLKPSKDTVSALEADKVAREMRPKWVMDEPPGYIHRGEDYDNDDARCTAQLIYKLPDGHQITQRENDGSELDESAREHVVFDYMARAARMAQSLNLPTFSTNLLDVAIETLVKHDYDFEQALKSLHNLPISQFKEPQLNLAEVKKFEEGVSKFGSEWYNIRKHVKTVKPKDIVRFYYVWKKTDSGKKIWGNYSGRKGKKEAKKAEATVGKLQDDVADDHDDSAFDNDKAYEKKRGFECKFCTTRSSRQWRRAPNTAAGTMIPEIPGQKMTGKDKGSQLMVALCRRCAELWRRYAIQWEDFDEVSKKIAQAGGRVWKRKIDEEILKELAAANEITNQATHLPSLPISQDGTPAPNSQATGSEPARKKMKVADRDIQDSVIESESVNPVGRPKKVVPAPGPPPPPEIPKPRVLPCAICGQKEPQNDQLLSCKECRMSVHKNCYGVVGENRSLGKWICDMCSNDKNPQVSVQYKCMLCPVEHTDHDFVEPPKTVPKKKTEKDRERERFEREAAQKVADFYRKRQEETNKPLNPREPLKRTANNNWVHVTCAVFTPEVRFGTSKALEPSEGIPSISLARYDETCKLCKAKGGACVGCHSCKAPVHVECAHQAGYLLGFDITPVKGSRRDQVNVITIDGETGSMTAAIWCKDHAPAKTIVHQMQEIVDDTGLNALQLYVQNFKQADLALTGTVRKATLINQSNKAVNPASVLQTNRRSSTTNTSVASLNGRGSISHVKVDDLKDGSAKTNAPEKVCATCGIDVSPKWWPFPPLSPNGTPSLSLNRSVESINEQDPANEPPSANGNAGHAALAAAALHQNTGKNKTEPKEVQCHKCHFKKVQRKDPTPPPPVISQELSRPPVPLQPASSVPPPNAEAPSVAPHYTWPQPPSFPSTNGPFNPPWPRHSPTPLVNQMNGGHPLHNNPASILPVNGQAPPVRQSVQAIPHSPRQNGHIQPGLSNGYPPSPHRIGASGVHLTNGGFPSFATTRPPPQHLTNGGPPPRAPEHPFAHANRPPLHHRSSFGPSQNSPPLLRDTHQQGRDTANSQHNGARPNDRPNDTRVNGGASASPSLRNLLS